MEEGAQQAIQYVYDPVIRYLLGFVGAVVSYYVIKSDGRWRKQDKLNEKLANTMNEIEKQIVRLNTKQEEEEKHK